MSCVKLVTCVLLSWVTTRDRPSEIKKTLTKLSNIYSGYFLSIFVKETLFLNNRYLSDLPTEVWNLQNGDLTQINPLLGNDEYISGHALYIVDKDFCKTPYGFWGEWSSCAGGSICGHGTKTRQRPCTDGPTGTDADCVGVDLEETTDCYYTCSKIH